jgi:N-methylhydantoinase B
MLGATQIGATELAKVVNEYGPTATQQLFSRILDHAERRMRAAVAELPDGVYTAEEFYHSDCFVPVKIRFCLTLTKAGENLTVDFSGTDPQIRGFKNSSLANTYSAVYAAVSSFFDEDLPRNEGTFRCISIIAPKGTLVNARSPAPVTMCTVSPAHEIMHMVWWALGKAVPDKALAGWGKNSFPVTAGSDRHGATWVMYNWGGCSGAGATANRDGFNQMGPMVSLGGLVIPNAETYEQAYPVTVIEHQFRQDGGGAGERRGGTGVVFAVNIETDTDYSFRGEGIDHPSGIGVCGGGDGVAGNVTLIAADGNVYKPFSYGVEQIGPRRLTIFSPGGGGFGNPLERDPASVLRDVRDGVVSREAALSQYGVVIAGDGVSIDQAATVSLRDAAMSSTS